MVYLDYAATNPWPEYRCSDYDYYTYFNPNANYAFGEKKLMRKCEERVKMAIGAKGGKVVFGGTASQLVENLMNFGRLFDERTSESITIIGSAFEHNSVDRFVNVNEIKTLADLEDELTFCKKIRIEHPIVCWMAVNNVTGTVFDVEAIGKLCHKYNAFYICDATALWGHIALPNDIDNWCDCIIQSSHKIGTELGLGFMWLSEDFNDWLGDFKLHGTPNVAGALAIADATEDAVKNVDADMQNWRDLAELMGSELNKADILVQGVYFGRDADRTHAINAIRLNGINARALQSYLASKQVYVGLGQSSCADENDNRILNAFGLTDEEASEVVRISFNETSNPEDVTTFVKYVKEFKEKYL